MTKYIEDSLGIELSDVLDKIQHRIMHETKYHGIPTYKNPLDFWVYQELIYALQPDFIVEIGNKNGGSTLALAHQMDLINHGQIVGIDIDQSRITNVVRNQPRINLIEKPALDAFSKVCDLVGNAKSVMVIEDSSHTYEHTLEVLNRYSKLVPVGGYFIVEDSICQHGIEVGPSPGPYEAIESFVSENAGFEIDRDSESFLITWNPKGFLKRIR